MSNIDWLHYLARIEEEIQSYDYSLYCQDATEVYNADVAYKNRVAAFVAGGCKGSLYPETARRIYNRAQQS